ELYRALAKSVVNKQKLPASSETGLDEQLKDVLGLFARATISEGDKREFDDWNGRLLAKDIQWRVHFADGNTNWNSRLEKCQKAAETGWVLACRAECLLQTDGNLEEAWKNASTAKVERETGDYAKYLQARVLHAKKQIGDAFRVLFELS